MEKNVKYDQLYKSSQDLKAKNKALSEDLGKLRDENFSIKDMNLVLQKAIEF